MLERLVEIFLTECGMVSFVELLVIAGTIVAIRSLWKKIEEKDKEIHYLGDTLLEALNSNTEVLSKLNEKLDGND